MIRSRRAVFFWVCAAFCGAPMAHAAVPGGGSDTAAQPGLLARVRQAGELRWGSDSQGGAPYVFQDPMDPNHVIGFEVDFAEALAARLSARARPVQGQWDGLLDLLARGDFEVAINGIEIADEKRRICELSRPYYAAAERLTVRRRDASA